MPLSLFIMSFLLFFLWIAGSLFATAQSLGTAPVFTPLGVTVLAGAAVVIAAPVAVKACKRYMS
jgi:hypothetical protein